MSARKTLPKIQTWDAMQTPITELTFPIASIGPLDSDLLSAFNAAVWSAGIAESMIVMLKGGSIQSCGGKQVQATVVSLVESWRNQCNACRKAVMDVVGELNVARVAIRGNPAKFGTITASNAHLAALAYARAVLTEIWCAADIQAWLRCGQDIHARMDSAVIVQNWEQVCQRFQEFSTVKAQEVVAEVQLEASQAQAANRQRERASGRLRLDPETQSVTLDGKSYPITDQKAYLFYEMVANQRGERITRAQIRAEVRGLRGNKAFSLVKERLPRAIRETVQSDPRGYWLLLPPSEKKVPVRP